MVSAHKDTISRLVLRPSAQSATQGVKRSRSALLDEDLRAARDGRPDGRGPGAAHLGRLPDVLPAAVLVEGREGVDTGDPDAVLTRTGAAVAVGLAVGTPCCGTATRDRLGGGGACEHHPHRKDACGNRRTHLVFRVLHAFSSEYRGCPLSRLKPSRRWRRNL